METINPLHTDTNNQKVLFRASNKLSRKAKRGKAPAITSEVLREAPIYTDFDLRSLLHPHL